MQSSAGWDWIASTADRNTGLWDRVALEALVATARMPRRRTKSMKTSIAAAYRLSDALVSTASIDGHAERGEALRGATLRPSVKINPVLHPSSAAHADGPSAAAAISILLVMRAFDEAHRPVACTCRVIEASAAMASPWTVQLPEVVVGGDDFGRDKLWWPHNLLPADRDRPHRYHGTFAAYTIHGKDAGGEEGETDIERVMVNATDFSFCANVDHSLWPFTVSHQSSTRLRFGIRTVDSFYDEVVGGRVFAVNGVSMFLEGGNWITTDIFLRYADQPQRYRDEVKLYKTMGINLIRGKGNTHETKFC